MNIVVTLWGGALGAVVAGLLETGRRRQRARDARLTREGQPVTAVVARIEGVGRYGALQRCEATFRDSAGHERVARWVWPTALVRAHGLQVGSELTVLHVAGSDLAGPPADAADVVTGWVPVSVFAFIALLGAIVGLVSG